MSKSLRRLALNTGRSATMRWIGRLSVATILAVLVAPPRTTKADSQQYSVVVRVDAKSAGMISGDIVVRVDHVRVPTTAIYANPDIPRDIAIVIDAGPDQAKVLPKEKDLAITLINQLSDAGTTFSIASVGTPSKMQAATLDRSVAIEHIRQITQDKGEKKNVPVYDAIGTAIREISVSPDLRVVIFIGEGNDGGSRLRYAELRSLAESNHIACFAALLADHNLRGAKSILRYGWNLQQLTSDTAGIFLENQEALKATQRLSESVRSLRLIRFEMPFRVPGRYKISVFSTQGKKLRAQKAIAIP